MTLNTTTDLTAGRGGDARRAWRVSTVFEPEPLNKDQYDIQEGNWKASAKGARHAFAQKGKKAADIKADGNCWLAGTYKAMHSMEVLAKQYYLTIEVRSAFNGEHIQKVGTGDKEIELLLLQDGTTPIYGLNELPMRDGNTGAVLMAGGTTGLWSQLTAERGGLRSPEAARGGAPAAKGRKTRRGGALPCGRQRGGGTHHKQPDNKDCSIICAQCCRGQQAGALEAALGHSGG